MALTSIYSSAFYGTMEEVVVVLGLNDTFISKMISVGGRVQPRTPRLYCDRATRSFFQSSAGVPFIVCLLQALQGKGLGVARRCSAARQGPWRLATGAARKEAEGSATGVATLLQRCK